MNAPSTPHPIRVLIVDDHRLVLTGLRLMCAQDPALEVVGQASTPEAAIAEATRTQPNVILLDVDLNGDSGLDAISELRAASPASRIVVMTGLRDPALQARALQLGTNGFVSKERSSEVILKAIRKVSEGELWFDRDVVSATVTHFLKTHETPTGQPHFTAREQDLIRLVGEGMSNGLIAQRLGISEKTVRNQLTVVFEKAQVRDRLQLAVYAFRTGLVQVPR